MFDISIPINSDMLLYPGDNPPVLRRSSSLELGDALTASELLIGCHVGTHIDAPAHFCVGGLTIDQLALKHFVGPAIILELVGRNPIEASHLAELEIPCDYHVLIKTDNSAHLRESEFRPNHCHLTPDAVGHILSRDPRSIGFDYYSLDPPSKTAFPVHALVAARGVPAYVCLDLSAVLGGAYQFFAAPIHVAGAEGMPVRALLMHRPV